MQMILTDAKEVSGGKDGEVKNKLESANLRG